jgi:membrane-bound lytic murein transglycosylase D
MLRDLEFSRAVHGWVEYWTVYATGWFPGFLTRMDARGSAVDSALAVRGFPPSLRYLPLIESGYDLGVTSRSGAVGLWQLMPTTARGLGLAVAPPVDARRHEEKTTEAALTYLAELHGEFGSWFLALAAYNTGPTRVRSVLRRYAPDEPRSDSLFWALRHRFSAETRDFVPKLYGAMWVASRPEAYGYGEPVEAPSEAALP